MKMPLCIGAVIIGGQLLSPALRAEIRLPALISDNMVLQQDRKANVWGWAEPGEKVSVRFADRGAGTTADADGKWKVTLNELKAGTSGEMTIKGKNSLTLKNVIVGEVWVCAGQSNMELRMPRVLKAQLEIANANFPLIRMFTVERAAKEQPQEDCVGKWEVCSPQTVSAFSAVGYFFGRQLYRDLNVPVGLIHSSWGGTPAELWTPRDALAKDKAFEEIVAAWAKKQEEIPRAQAAYEKELAEWKAAVEVAKAQALKAPVQPLAPQVGAVFGSPGCLYNGMIAPLTSYTIQGVTWYQGEANASRAAGYRQLFRILIESWRQSWAGELPFLYVQLANYNARKVPPTGQPEDSHWAEVREAQFLVLNLPRTAMAVTIDIGNPNDIHPANKQEVGRRLALAAEGTVYNQPVIYSGPRCTGGQTEEGQIRLNFLHAEGMKTADGESVKGFAVAGADQRYVWAEAVIRGDNVLVSSPQVPTPLSVRYGWADNPTCNLVNDAWLPASPFRTDTFPQVIPAEAK